MQEKYLQVNEKSGLKKISLQNCQWTQSIRTACIENSQKDMLFLENSFFWGEKCLFFSLDSIQDSSLTPVKHFYSPAFKHLKSIT